MVKHVTKRRDPSTKASERCTRAKGSWKLKTRQASTATKPEPKNEVKKEVKQRKWLSCPEHGQCIIQPEMEGKTCIGMGLAVKGVWSKESTILSVGVMCLNPDLTINPDPATCKTPKEIQNWYEGRKFEIKEGSFVPYITDTVGLVAPGMYANSANNIASPPLTSKRDQARAEKKRAKGEAKRTNAKYDEARYTAPGKRCGTGPGGGKFVSFQVFLDNALNPSVTLSEEMLAKLRNRKLATLMVRAAKDIDAATTPVFLRVPYVVYSKERTVIASGVPTTPRVCKVCGLKSHTNKLHAKHQGKCFQKQQLQ
jgi:hypothetical protein